MVEISVDDPQLFPKCFDAIKAGKDFAMVCSRNYRYFSKFSREFKYLISKHGERNRLRRLLDSLPLGIPLAVWAEAIDRGPYSARLTENRDGITISFFKANP
jgi:hypothetical protein